MYTRYQRAVMVWGCGHFLPFISKCILGIKCILPCSFGNKRMHLLTHVYSIQFQPELLTSIIINCQRFDYSAVVFLRAHLHTTLGILLNPI